MEGRITTTAVAIAFIEQQAASGGDPAAGAAEAFRMAGKACQIYDKLQGEQTKGQLLAQYDDHEERELFCRVVYLLTETGLAISSA